MNLIILKKTTICRRDHWMLYSEPDEIINSYKTVNVPYIKDAIFEHQEIVGGLLRDTAIKYQAVRHGDEIFKVFFDLKTGTWTGELTVYSPRQGTYFHDYAPKVRESLLANGWQVTV